MKSSRLKFVDSKGNEVIIENLDLTKQYGVKIGECLKSLKEFIET